MVPKMQGRVARTRRLWPEGDCEGVVGATRRVAPTSLMMERP